MINPQYRLSLHPKLEKAKVTLTLQVGKDLPVNVAMVWSQGQRISERVPRFRVRVLRMTFIIRFSEKELSATSGAYSYGLARVTKAISGRFQDV
jgi:calpain-7